MVVSVSFLQHEHFSEAVTAVFGFSVNSFFGAPVLDVLFLNFMKLEKSDLDFLKMDVSAILI